MGTSRAVIAFKQYKRKMPWTFVSTSEVIASVVYRFSTVLAGKVTRTVLVCVLLSRFTSCSLLFMLEVHLLALFDIHV